MKDDKSILNAFEENQEVKTIDASRKLRVGFIGTGWIAGAHIQAYLNQPDVEIVAAADLIPGKAAAFFKKHGVEGVKTDYPSHKEMLDDASLKLDAVSVCTYNRQHAAPAIYALNKGVNVLLEKPFTVTTEEAIEVMRAEKKSGKVLSIGFQPRFDENMKMIKKIVESGTLGKIYYIQTGGCRRRGIPTPFEPRSSKKTPRHRLPWRIGAIADMGLNAIGYPKPLTVSGYKSAFFGTDPNYSNYVKTGHPEYAKKFGVDDFAAAFVRLEGGIILDFRIAWAMHMDTPATP
jgi:predicted dehydrogenase